eukprot:9495167-Pyramimonas_sp.AAC.1
MPQRPARAVPAGHERLEGEASVLNGVRSGFGMRKRGMAQDAPSSCTRMGGRCTETARRRPGRRRSRQCGAAENNSAH